MPFSYPVTFTEVQLLFASTVKHSAEGHLDSSSHYNWPTFPCIVQGLK